MSTPYKCKLVAVVGMLMISVATYATELRVGDSLAGFEIADQHGKPGTVDEDVKLIMFSRDMSANKLAKRAFMEKPVNYLPEHHSVYMIDVSGMPKFVTRMFAIPKMQKYPYRIFLDKDASLTTALPTKKKKVTLVHVDNLMVTSVVYVDSAAALVSAVTGAGQAQTDSAAE